jgi:hypothetical protein
MLSGSAARAPVKLSTPAAITVGSCCPRPSAATMLATLRAST